ncbi:MAG: universal stress protein [Putridiphycobacter sp.]
MSKQTLIVPHDFTEVADAALKHAVVTANIVGADVHVLHVVEKKVDINPSTEKLNTIVEKFDNPNNVNLVTHVRVGNIFDDIGDFASELHAELIFMGTHGAHGWQHITGSHALKVVTQSAVPFVIVQADNIDDNGYDDIVVPLDLHKETKQKLTVVANMAKYFNSKVHVVIPDEKDEYLKRTVNANIIFANKFFSERGIAVSTDILSPKNFDEEVINYAKNINADLITIMNLSKNQMFQAISAKHEQNMITNDAKIPVLLVNPVTTANTVQYLFAQ